MNVKKVYRAELSWDNSEIEYADKEDNWNLVQFECIQRDYSIFAFPIHVLGTNRTLDTAISRQQNPKKILMSRGLNDLVNISKLNGIKGLFAGFIPYAYNHMKNHWEYQLFKKDDGLFIQMPKFKLYDYVRD